ncbi:uncharacterized protein ACRADG_001737 [Cochliomyia hominivorax]
MSWQNNEIQFENYINYDEVTNIGQCLVPECHTVFIGKKIQAIKRHYRTAHKINIEGDDGGGEIDDNDSGNTMTETIHNNEVNTSKGERNPFVCYSIKYVNDSNRNNVKTNLNNETLHNDNIGEGGGGGGGVGKGYRTFLVADYVDYNKATNTSKCLVKNCERPMSGRRTGNIKRHYHKVHNFVIVHDNQEETSLRDMKRELKEYYNNELFGDSGSAAGAGVMEEDNEEDLNESTDMEHQPVNYEQFIDYDPLINKSLCKVPGCKVYLAGKKPLSIARHYSQVHNYDIESNGIKIFDKSKFSKVCNAPTTGNSSCLIPIDDLVIFEPKSQTYQCLFINCNQVLEKHLPSIKRHYHEKHKIIIARDSDNIPHRFYRKRKQHEMQNSCDPEYSRDYQDFSYEQPSTLYSIKNELLSDDEQPQCSKRPNNNSFSNYLIPETELGALKKEYQSDEEHFTLKSKLKEKFIKNESNFSYPHHKSLYKENTLQIEISLTKEKFFNLCFGLILKRNLSLQLFDDDQYFKPLLQPYEDIFEYPVNSSTMENLLKKANDIVVNDLRDLFKNKILSLEFYVQNHLKNYYLIFNIRFLQDETVQNKQIGYISLTESFTIIPISQLLNKFNIDESQIYIKTLLPASYEDPEIYKICENLFVHNPELKKHPIYDLQILLRKFKQSYALDIKKWLELINLNKLHYNVWQNLKDFEKHLENFVSNDIDEKSELQEAKNFIKTLEIFHNFMEKLAGEQYVAGDFYRDWLCCELELKNELKKNNNKYAGNLNDELLACKTSLMESKEFMAALYLDARFNFLASRLISEEQKTKGKLFLCSLDERFNKYIQSSYASKTDSSNNDQANEENMDDEYALLNEHINDIMPSKCNESLQDKLINCIPTKREPFSLDILKYWHANRQHMEDINELTKIAFTFPCSQFVLKNLQYDFVCKLESEKYNKFLLKCNYNILEKNLDIIF